MYFQFTAGSSNRPSHGVGPFFETSRNWATCRTGSVEVPLPRNWLPNTRMSVVFTFTLRRSTPPARTFSRSPASVKSFVQPPSGSQPSTVFPLLSPQTSGTPGMHCPVPLHDATPSQTSSLSQSAPAPLAGFEQPLVGSQLSNVQGLPSTQLSACPSTHAPDWQVSGPLQTLPSEHDVP